MPHPHKDEKRSDYISRCVRQLKREEPGKALKACLGKCYGMWEQSHTTSEKDRSSGKKENLSR